MSMNQTDNLGDYSTQKISPNLISKIVEVLRNKAYGSVEIYIENFSVTQITERTITKLSRPKQITKRFSIKVLKNRNFSSSSQAQE